MTHATRTNHETAIQGPDYRRVCGWLITPRPDGWIETASDDGSWQHRTHTDIASAVGAFATVLADAGVGHGDRVAIAVPSGFEAVVAIFAAWRRGAAITMIPLPLMGAGPDYLDHVADILRITDPAVLVVAPDHTAVFDGLTSRGIEVPQVGTGDPIVGVDATDPVPVDAADCAVLQFTSGSSGTPKGVRISWRNLASNIELISAATSVQTGDLTTTWLPLYHDMGLIGGLLTTLAGGGNLRILRPDQFVIEPHRWIHSLAESAFTVCPSFGLGHAARRVSADDLDDLDLSGLRAVITGAEPVSADDVSAFAELLRPYGFDLDCLRPAYGLAEATLMATITQAGQGLPVLRIDSVTAAFGRPVDILDEADYRGGPLAGDGWVWGVGVPDPTTTIRITDGDGADLADGTLGEIVVHGPGVSPGYATGSATDTDAGSGTTSLTGSELHTGDAGFRHRGILYVIGRMGSSLKVRGTTLFMEAIDDQLARETGLAKQKFAAVAAQDAGRGPGIVLFSEHAPGPWVDTARELLRARLGPAPRLTIVTGGRGLIRRTSSGKPRRRVMWDLYRADELGSDATVVTDNVEQDAGADQYQLSDNAVLADNEIISLLDKALDAVDLPSEVTVALEGSIAEGFGNAGSDIDFLVVTAGDATTPEMPTVLFIDGRRVEVRTRSEAQLRAQLDYLRSTLGESSTDRVAILEANQDVLNRCQRFLRSQTIRRGPADIDAIRAGLPFPEFTTAMGRWWRARAAESLRQGMAMSVLGDASADAWLRDGLLQSVKCWAAARGETYIESKWTGPQLARIGDEGISARYHALDEQLSTGHAEFGDVLALAADLGVDVGGDHTSVRLGRARGVTSWPIDGRIHVLRGGDVFVLSDRAARCWRAMVFGRPLSEVSAPMTADERRIVARFLRFGMVGVRWQDAGPIMPAVAMVKPHKPATPPPSTAVSLIGISGATAEGDITLSPLPAARFAGCASALIWSNVLVENAREDLVGALANEQWRVADRAADRLVKSVVRVLLSTVGCSPLPPDVAAAATLDELLPAAMTDRTAVLRDIGAADGIRFGTDDPDHGLAVLDALVETARSAAGLRFPASFDSREQWRATLTIAYDWLRMAAYLDAELPIDEVSDLLTSGGAQPHQRVVNSGT